MTDLLWQYLLEGDFLGFVTSVYTSIIGQIFWVFILLLITMPIYIRTRSLPLLCILWLLLGGVIIGTVPIASGVAVLFMALGIAGLLFQLFQKR